MPSDVRGGSMYWNAGVFEWPAWARCEPAMGLMWRNEGFKSVGTSEKDVVEYAEEREETGDVVEALEQERGAEVTEEARLDRLKPELILGTSKFGGEVDVSSRVLPLRRSQRLPLESKSGVLE